MDIGQLSRVTGVSTNTLRHYQQLGLLSGGDDANSGPGRYSEAHIHTVKLIKLATGLGFRLREILDVLDAKHRGDDNKLRNAMDVVILRSNKIENGDISAVKKKQLLTLQSELESIIDAP